MSAFQGKNQRFTSTPAVRWMVSLTATTMLSTLLTNVGFANVVGNDAQLFNPTPSGLDYITVRSSKVLDPGQYSIGLFLNDSVNTLPYYDKSDTPQQSRMNWNDQVVGADFGASYGILKDWEIGLNLPAIAMQTVKSDDPHGQFANTGNTDIRISSKYRLWTNGRTGIAGVATANINRMKDNPYVGGSNAAPIYSAELVADTMIDQFSVAGNIGYRWRQSGKDDGAPVQVLKNDMILSTAVGYMLPSINSQVIGEIYGKNQMDQSERFAGRTVQTSEALLSMKYFASKELTYSAGTGTELNHGYASPSWRFFAGINWTSAVEKSIAKPAPAPASAPVAVSKKPDETIVLNEVFFDFDSANLVRSGSNQTLDKIGAQLAKSTNFKKLIIEGHTCSIGDQSYNRQLSQRRANTIRSWLIRKYNLSPDKIEAVGVGAAHPIADNRSFNGREKNRRVEFKIFNEK